MFRALLFGAFLTMALPLLAQLPGPERPVSSITTSPRRLLATASTPSGKAIAAWGYGYSPPTEFGIGRFNASGEPLDGDGVRLHDAPHAILPRRGGGFELVGKHRLNQDGHASVVLTEVFESATLTLGTTKTLFDRGWWYFVDGAANGEELLVVAARPERGTTVILARSFDAARNLIHEERVATVTHDIGSLDVVWTGEAWLVIWSDVAVCRITCVSGDPFVIGAARLDRNGRSPDPAHTVVMEGEAYFTPPRAAAADDRAIIAASSERGTFVFEVGRDGRVDRRPLELPIAAVYDIGVDAQTLTILFAPYDMHNFIGDKRLARLEVPIDPATILARSVNVAEFDSVGRVTAVTDGQLLFFERSSVPYVQPVSDLVRPLTPPAGLVVTRINDTDVSLSWSDRSEDETGFLIEFQKDRDAVKHRGEVIANRRSAIIRDLTPGRWSFRVRSKKHDLTSAASEVAIVRIGSEPGAPVITAVADGARDSVVVSWTDNATNEWNYSVQLIDAASGKWLGAGAGENQTQATVRNTKAGTLYWVTVRANLKNGESAAAEDVLFRTAPGRNRPVRPRG